MILEYILNSAKLILVFRIFFSKGGEEHHSLYHGQCFKELKQSFAAHQGGFVSKYVSLIYVSHLPSWQAYVVV